MPKKYRIGFVIIVLLTAIGIVGCAYNLLEGKSIVNTMAKLVSLILIAFYAVIGYKKPHGNLLKYLMLICDILIIFSINNGIRGKLQVYVVARLIEVIMISYMAGRLERIEQNKYIALIVLIISIYCASVSISFSESFEDVIRKLTPTIIWLDLCGAYFLRYVQHKEAGLLDK